MPDPRMYPSGPEFIPSSDIETEATSADLIETYDATTYERKAASVAALIATGAKVQAIAADAAIDDDATLVTLDSSGTALDVDLAAPTAGRFLVIAQIDAGTDGHTVTLAAGTWDGTNDVATFNAANECLIVFGISATRFVIVENIGAVAFS